MKEFNMKYTFGKGFFLDGTKTFSIKQEDIGADMNKDDLEELYHDVIFDHFRENISPTGKNRCEFTEWAKGVISKRSKD